MYSCIDVMPSSGSFSTYIMYNVDARLDANLYLLNEIGNLGDDSAGNEPLFTFLRRIDTLRMIYNGSKTKTNLGKIYKGRRNIPISNTGFLSSAGIARTNQLLT
uniref:Uncharacterized protein n=1 Tax=Cacopsylla melanoneura TaxID=428564 RepID=A0A8D8L9F0_9HEMI